MMPYTMQLPQPSVNWLPTQNFEILQALAEALDLSLDNLIEKNLSAEEQGLNQLKAYYHSCLPEMRETLLNRIQAFTKELTALAEKMDKD